jgi:hypothetical protein
METDKLVRMAKGELKGDYHPSNVVEMQQAGFVIVDEIATELSSSEGDAPTATRRKRVSS